MNAANDAVKHGNAVGVMYFSRNFSTALEKKITDLQSTSDDDLQSAEIEVYLDMGST